MKIAEITSNTIAVDRLYLRIISICSVISEAEVQVWGVQAEFLDYTRCSSWRLSAGKSSIGRETMMSIASSIWWTRSASLTFSLIYQNLVVLSTFLCECEQMTALHYVNGPVEQVAEVNPKFTDIEQRDFVAASIFYQQVNVAGRCLLST